MEGVRGRRVRMRGGHQGGEEGGRGRGRGRLGPEEAIEPEQRRRGPNLTQEIRATLVDHVINHGLTLREAGQRVQYFLQSYCNNFFLHMRKLFCSDCPC